MREITSADARIEWSVHLTNGKAAGPRFDATGRRNAGVPVKDLVIDATLQKISGASRAMKRLRGKFMGVTVPLGDLLTDSAGRLVVLGGFGKSQSVPAGRVLMDFANNDGWCDDTSDGPVRATIKLKGASKTVEAEAAWVIVGPPDFAPEIESVITLYDVVRNVAAKLHSAFDVRSNMPVSFTEHIYPILRRATLNIWVNYLARRGHGQDTNAYFLAPELLALLSNNSRAAGALPHAHAAAAAHHDHDDEDTSTPAGFRHHVLEHLRDPKGGGGDMPMLNPQRGPGAPALTELQYRLMERWAEICLRLAGIRANGAAARSAPTARTAGGIGSFRARGVRGRGLLPWHRGRRDDGRKGDIRSQATLPYFVQAEARCIDAGHVGAVAGRLS